MKVGLDISKQPAEIFPWGVDFAPELGEGESVNSAVFRAVKESDGTDATSALGQGSPSTTGSVVVQVIKAGVDGESYMLELKATTSLGYVWEAERRLLVRDIPTPVV